MTVAPKINRGNPSKLCDQSEDKVWQCPPIRGWVTLIKQTLVPKSVIMTSVNIRMLPSQSESVKSLSCPHPRVCQTLRPTLLTELRSGPIFGLNPPPVTGLVLAHCRQRAENDLSKLQQLELSWLPRPLRTKYLYLSPLQMLHNIGQSGGSLYFLWQRQVPGGVRASEGLSYTELHRVTPSPLYLFLWWVLGPDSTQFPVCQLPAADLHRLSPSSNNPLLTVLLWLEEFTCIWNSLARQILWTDPRTIFQCCNNTPDYLHPWPSWLLPGAEGPDSSQWLIKMFKLSPDFVQISILHGQVFNIWSECPMTLELGVYSVSTQVYTDLMHLYPGQFSWVMNLILGKAVETIMTRSCLKLSSHVPWSQNEPT